MSLKYKAYKEECMRFLEENAKRDEVVELDNGSQYEVITPGSGRRPNPKSTIRVRYKGTLIDGTVFDDTFKDRMPQQFRLRDLIEGWQEALLLMQEGAHWRIYLPYYLGYGTKGSGIIKPYSTLIFDIQLLGVK
ncbi:MAG: FKBP-type peptidyl-prolyl cis-trans isomerase [Marinifilaceae bacterium]